MFLVKYKFLFYYLIYPSVPNCRRQSICIFSKFSLPLACNDPPHWKNLCNFLPFHHFLPWLLQFYYVLHVTSKTLETVNVSRDSQSLKPSKKGEIDFVEM